MSVASDNKAVESIELVAHKMIKWGHEYQIGLLTASEYAHKVSDLYVEIDGHLGDIEQSNLENKS